MRNRRKVRLHTTMGVGLSLGAMVVGLFPHLPLPGQFIVTLLVLGMLAFSANRISRACLLVLLTTSLGALAVAWIGWGGVLTLPMLGVFAILASSHLFVGQQQGRGSERRLHLVRRNERLARALERSNRTLALSNQAKARLLAAASHDLRQPVQALAMLVDLMDQPGHRMQHLGNARSCADALSDKLQQLLDFNRLASGRYCCSRHPVSIDDILLEAEAAFAPVARQRGLEFRVVRCGARVDSDAYLLRRLVFNLADNAVKFTLAGSVSLEGSVRGATVLVQVRDTGAGIAPLRLAQLLAQHHGLPAAAETSPSQEGLGLGMSIVRKGAELLGYAVTIESEPGIGTAVTLRLGPCETHGAGFEEDEEPLASNSLAGCKVAVFSDDDVSLAAWRDTLVGWGCRYSADATAAPDLVLADLGSAADGLRAVEQLRQRVRQPRLPGVVVTDDLDSDDSRRCAARAVLLAPMPVRPAQLQQFLHQAIARGRVA